MCLQAHSMWTALVQPPSFLQVANRYILPNGQHLDTLIQEGGAPPLQFLQFVQESVGKKTWADAEWAKLLPADLWVDTATGKTGKRKWLNGDVLQQGMDFIRDQHGVTSDSRCPFRIASIRPTHHRTVTRHTQESDYVSLRQPTSTYVSLRQSTSAYVSIRQHTSAHVSLRQPTSAYVSGSRGPATVATPPHYQPQLFFFQNSAGQLQTGRTVHERAKVGHLG
jgi:hypothetical protein